MSGPSIRDVFMQKILFPRAFIIDKPGFITGRYFELLGIGKFTRHIFLPEGFFTELENTIVKDMGRKGKRLLYL
jgi:hypothetical protein